MLWFVLLASWFAQLHWLDTSPWLGAQWPVFVVVVLLISNYLPYLSLIWALTLLGVIADISSHLPVGLVIVQYVGLVIAVSILSLMRGRQHQRLWQLLAIILVVCFITLSQVSNIESLKLVISHEFIISVAMAVIVYGLARLAIVNLRGLQNG